MTAPGAIADEAVLIETSPRRVDGYLPIEDYAAIGDGRTVALVGIDGSIDWMCLPELDAPSVFTRVLAPTDGGAFALEPAIPYRVRRSYLSGTNVLATELTTADGSVRVTDALTFDGSQVSWRELVRQVEGLSGAVPMRWSVRPRFDFGCRGSRPRPLAGVHVFRHERLALALRCWGAGEARLRDDSVDGSFEIASGERALLALVAGDDVALPCPSREDLERRLNATAQAWREWVRRSSYDGPWKDDVDRSLLALALLADGRTGAIAAASTLGLPETIGGDRNYDYRFGWVRDLSFTVESLLSVGMRELAHTAVVWLLGAVARTHPRVDPVYALTGDVVRSQHELGLPGYRRTSPVRVGNGAGSQLQLGGFGDLLEALHLYVDAGHLLAPAAGERLADCADLLCSIWRSEDAGLWELETAAQYTTSKLGCWTCLRRMLDLAESGQARPVMFRAGAPNAIGSAGSSRPGCGRTPVAAT